MQQLDTTRTFLVDHVGVRDNEPTPEGTIFSYSLARAVAGKLAEAFPDADPDERVDLSTAAAIGVDTLMLGLVNGLHNDLLEYRVPMPIVAECAKSKDEEVVDAAVDYAVRYLRNRIDNLIDDEEDEVG